MPSVRSELEICCNVLGLIEQVEKGYAERYPDCSLENRIIKYPETDSGVRPYLIWDIATIDITTFETIVIWGSFLNFPSS